MNQVLARFEQFLKRRFGQSSTPIHYISDLNLFIQTLNNNKPLETVTATDIDRFIEQQIAAGMSVTTINRRLASLHTFFEYLASEKPEQSWSNPVIRRRHSLKTRSRLPRDVPDSDVARLFAVIMDERDLAMFGLMVGAGVRVSELLDLRLSDSNVAAGYTTIRGGKPRRDRVVYLTPALSEALRCYLDQRPHLADDHVFLLHEQVPTPRTIQRRLAAYGQQAGVEVSPHRLKAHPGDPVTEPGDAHPLVAQALRAPIP